MGSDNLGYALCALVAFAVVLSLVFLYRSKSSKTEEFDYYKYENMWGGDRLSRFWKWVTGGKEEFEYYGENFGRYPGSEGYDKRLAEDMTTPLTFDFMRGRQLGGVMPHSEEMATPVTRDVGTGDLQDMLYVTQ